MFQLSIAAWQTTLRQIKTERTWKSNLWFLMTLQSRPAQPGVLPSNSNQGFGVLSPIFSPLPCSGPAFLPRVWRNRWPYPEAPHQRPLWGTYPQFILKLPLLSSTELLPKAEHHEHEFGSVWIRGLLHLELTMPSTSEPSTFRWFDEADASLWLRDSAKAIPSL